MLRDYLASKRNEILEQKLPAIKVGNKWNDDVKLCINIYVTDICACINIFYISMGCSESNIHDIQNPQQYKGIEDYSSSLTRLNGSFENYQEKNHEDNFFMTY